MTKAFPAFIDLRTLADELADKHEYRRLRSELDRAAKAQSCDADLALAETQMEALAVSLGSPRKRGTLIKQATEGALLQMAIILYERATAAAGKRGERGSIGLRDLLTKDQQQDHDAVVLVRQRALAHVYPNEIVAGVIWQRDLLLGVADGRSWQPLAATKRIQFNQQTYERLGRQLPITRALLLERFRAHLTKAISLMKANPLPQAIFDRHEIDPIAAFGSRQNVLDALAGRTVGEISFLGD